MSSSHRQIYVIGGALDYANWMEGQIVYRMEDADLCVYSGGSDISVSLYGAKAHPSTSSSPKRDEYEAREFKRARSAGLPMIGICRGLQFLTAMAGGKLVQDQPDPSSNHMIETYDGRSLIVTSSHHQAAHPWNLPANQFKVLAWSVGQSSYHHGYGDEEMVLGVAPQDREVEAAFYPAINALGFQGHPEWQYDGALQGVETCVESINWHREQLNRLIDGTL